MAPAYPVFEAYVRGNPHFLIDLDQRRRRHKKANQNSAHTPYIVLDRCFGVSSAVACTPVGQAHLENSLEEIVQLSSTFLWVNQFLADR